MNKKAFSLAEIAKMTNAELIGNPQHIITNIADLESAGSEDASFLGSPLYEKAMLASNAGVVFITSQAPQIEGRNFLITETPSRAFQQLIEIFVGEALHRSSGFEGIHPTAVVHPTATIGTNVTIGPHAVIDKNASIGNNTTIASGCFVGLETTIGENCYLYANVTIRERCKLGNRVIIQPGAVIGSCGFGYTTNAQGQHTKLNQVGIVAIGDDVEIGANTTIDRSRFKATSIGQGSKIDNLVQIGHGVCVGKHVIIVSQTGIAGSTTIGDHVVIAGQVAIAGHLDIASKTQIAGRSGVSKSIKEPGKYGGLPLLPLNEYMKNNVLIRNLSHYVNEIKELKKRLSAIEKA